MTPGRLCHRTTLEFQAVLLRFVDLFDVKERDRLGRSKALAHPLVECRSNTGSPVCRSGHRTPQFLPERLWIGVEPHHLRGGQSRRNDRIITVIAPTSSISHQGMRVRPPRCHPISVLGIINSWEIGTVRHPGAGPWDDALIGEHRPWSPILGTGLRSLAKLWPRDIEHGGKEICVLAGYVTALSS